jgi:hypothetical protein
VNVQVPSMQCTPALSAQSAFEVQGVPTSAPMTMGELFAPTQNEPRSPLSEVRAVQLCCGPQSFALVHLGRHALSTHRVPDAQAESRHFFWHSPSTVTPGQADAHEDAASQPQSANTRPITVRGTPRSLTRRPSQGKGVRPGWIPGTGLSFRAMMRRAVAVLPLLAACACSSQSAVDFDRGQSTAGGAQTYGTGERRPYPSAPYGSTIGATIENFHFLGWTDPKAIAYDETHLDDIDLARFYNPSGASDRPKFLVITSTAVWCSACKVEYVDMVRAADIYRKKGVEFFGALFQDGNTRQGPFPAKPSDLNLWASTYEVPFHFVLDPALKLGNFFDVEATPMEMIIDTSNMQILHISTGWARSSFDEAGNIVNAEGSFLWELDQLLGG